MSEKTLPLALRVACGISRIPGTDSAARKRPRWFRENLSADSCLSQPGPVELTSDSLNLCNSKPDQKVATDGSGFGREVTHACMRVLRLPM